MKQLSRAIVVAFHKYTPFGGEFYEPLLDFFIQNMKKYQDEFDTLYLVDSTWNIEEDWNKVKVIKVNPNLRYYDAYKEILPKIEEHLILFMDNDMVIYKKGVIDATFEKLGEGFDVVSIYDTIGTFTSPLLNGKSKFCPYWFATGTAMLKDFTKCQWGPVAWGETLSELTTDMLKEDIKPFEWEEDKSNCLYDGTQEGNKSKDLGYYHIRAGSTPAVLLAWENSPEHREEYKKYIEQQPKTEYLRQCAWYQYIGGNPERIVLDTQIELVKWNGYIERFKKYHGLI
jgi:hypothetical protein